MPRPRIVAVVSLLIAMIAPPLIAPPAHASGPAPFPGEQSWRAESVAAEGFPDPHHASPEAVAAFFARLGAGRAERLAQSYPAIVGNLDGAPAALRYAANRQAIANSGSQYPSLNVAGRTFLAFDPRGDGRAVEVVGDLTTADHIAVLAPGADTTLGSFDRGHGGRAYRAPAVQARVLHAAARTIDPAARVAVIAWLGYDTPEGIGRAAIGEDRAAAGAAALSRFLASLHGVRPQATVTVVGHSYGSVVAGLTARDRTARIDDLVAVGSPGLATGRAAELPGAARVWVGRACDDWIRWVPGVQLLGAGHGADPTAPAFGARRFTVTGAVGHDRYLAPGTESLRNIARITLGRHRDVTTPAA